MKLNGSIWRRLTQLILRILNEGSRIEHDLVSFLQTRLDNNKLIVAVA